MHLINKCIVIIRHGERMDDNLEEKSKVVVTYDPHLSTIGIN